MWLAKYLAIIWRSHDKVGKGQSVQHCLDGMMVVLMFLGSSATKVRLHGSLDTYTVV